MTDTSKGDTFELSEKECAKAAKWIESHECSSSY